MPEIAKFRIPKLSDREILTSLNQIQEIIAELVKLDLEVVPFQGSKIGLPQKDAHTAKEIQYALDDTSHGLSSFKLLSGGRIALQILRKHPDVTDEATILDDWLNQLNQGQHTAQRSRLAVKLFSLTREKFKVADIEAGASGQEDSEWNRYREAQTTVINSLQQTLESITIKAADHNAELDRKRTEHFEKLEEKLRSELTDERTKLVDQIEKQKSKLDQREKALDEREATFETKESHYVARQKQGEQIEQIKTWLEDWSLTRGTSKKRWPIASAYIVALVATGSLTIYATWHSYDLLKSVDEIIKLAWWQWAAIWAKSLFPLAAFATFMIYFIRWSGDWARQHSEEEFRNRTRLIDIGRSAWILEAVRDAQERNKELPKELLHELSRNLFAANIGPDNDIHPQAISDFMMQGLSSLRVKSADGTEVEASRNKKSK